MYNVLHQLLPVTTVFDFDFDFNFDNWNKNEENFNCRDN